MIRDRSLEDDALLTTLEGRLDYHFQHRELLLLAMIHRSFPAARNCSEPEGAEKRSLVGNNERLEYLGDAVLNLLISHMLFRQFPEAPEGILSQWRASLVNTTSLAGISSTLGLGAILRLGHGEERSGGRSKPTILADALEALLGAIYLDSGLEAVQTVVERLFGDAVHAIRPGQSDRDYKSLLQERLQGAGRPLPEYCQLSVAGAPHDRRFVVACMIEGQKRGCGIGRSKRMAEQEAARAAIESLEQPETEKDQHDSPPSNEPLEAAS